MSWKCPECGSLNNNSIISCTCGYEKGTTTAPRLELLQTTSAEDTESKKNKVYKNLTPYKGGTPIEKFFHWLGCFVFLLAATTNSLWAILIFMGAYYLLILILVGRPCPLCGAWRAGEIKSTRENQTFLKCKYCDSEWIIEETSPRYGG